MPPLTPRQILDRQMSERQVQHAIEQAMKQSRFTWLGYHTYNSQHSREGFPDWLLISPPWLCFWELKKETEKPSQAQRVWLSRLQLLHVNSNFVSVAVIRPSNMPQATTFLLTLANPPTLDTKDSLAP